MQVGAFPGSGLILGPGSGAEQVLGSSFCQKNPNPVASAYKPSSGDNDILGLSGKRYPARHHEITIFGPLARHQSLVMRSQDNCHMTMLMEEIR
jgi:hypothetical protein